MIEYGLLAGGIGGLLSGVASAFGQAGDMIWQVAADYPVVALSLFAALLAWTILKRR